MIQRHRIRRYNLHPELLPEGVDGEAWARKLTQRQLKALNEYSCNGYRAINHYLRFGTIMDYQWSRWDRFWQTYDARKLARRLKGISPMIADRDFVVHRGTLVDKQGREAGIWSDSGFISTSLREGVAHGFYSYGNENLHMTTMEITVTKGTPYIPISFGLFAHKEQHFREKEILLLPGTIFQQAEITEPDKRQVKVYALPPKE